jgi:hypothetical protein
MDSQSSLPTVNNREFVPMCRHLRRQAFTKESILSSFEEAAGSHPFCLRKVLDLVEAAAPKQHEFAGLATHHAKDLLASYKNIAATKHLEEWRDWALQ